MHLYKLEYFYDGNGVCEINGNDSPFEEGDISFASPLDIHGYKSDRNVKTLTVHFKLANLNPFFLEISNINACLIKSTEEMKNAFNILICQNPSDEVFDLLCEKITETILILFLKQL